MKIFNIIQTYHKIQFLIIYQMYNLFNDEEEGNRVINFENIEDKPNRKIYPKNNVSTTKYNIITFLPKSLLIQAVKPANFVYLLSGALQFIKIINTSTPIVALSPFLVLMAVSILREAYEDYKRHRNDQSTNNSKSRKLINSQFQVCKWKDIEVGDFIKINHDQLIPADIILISSSEQNGICYVETANIDGQRNLKSKTTFLGKIKLNQQQIKNLKGVTVIDPPNNRIHELNGNVTLQNMPTFTLSDNNILLRGTKLKNTNQVIGFVIYTGQQTKIMKSRGSIKHKVSEPQKRINLVQLVLAIILIIICIFVGAMYYGHWKKYGTRQNIFYLRTSSDLKYSLGTQSVFICLSAFLLLNFLVPISLSINIEILKTFQGDLLGYDDKMSLKIDNDIESCGVTNSTIIEQLGAVQYILTDKTGTLTSNTMVFKQIWTDNQQYTSSQMEDHKDQLINSIPYRRFWTSVILCHDVVVDGRINQYHGSSTDQVCFLNFAKKIGFQFKKRTANELQIQINGTKKVYELLLVIPFNQRKMMSVIVKNVQNNQIILMAKGADNVILNRRNINEQNQKNVQKLRQSLLKFAKLGFRTIVFGQRLLHQKEFRQMQKRYKAFIDMKLNNSLSRNQIKQIQIKTFANFQQNLQIFGVSAVEDSLQQGVPETIKNLQQADITIAMITGDKLQTAQNIGYLSNFISENTTIYRIRQENPQQQSQILQISKQISQKHIKLYSLLIEGTMISRLLTCDNQQITAHLIQLFSNCKSLIFCRSSPSQKGQIVNYFKNNLKKIILAIGDGGNDVTMIQEADIGIGIIGKEGNQAVAASDFHIGQFRFLDRLILHHGRWGSMRVSYFFVFFGYKSVLMTMVLFYYMFYCGYSAQQFLTDTFIISYNTILSVSLTIYYGVWYQDINDDLQPHLKKRLPYIYQYYRKLNPFSYKRYFIWSFAGLLVSILIFFVSIYALNPTSSIDSHGHIIDFKGVLVNISVSMILVVVLTILNDIHNYTPWTWFNVLGLTFLVGILFYIIDNYVNFQRFSKHLISNYHIFTENTNGIFCFVIIFNVMVCFSVKILIQTIEFYDYPDLIQQIMLDRVKPEFNAIVIKQIQKEEKQIQSQKLIKQQISIKQ